MRTAVVRGAGLAIVFATLLAGNARADERNPEALERWNQCPLILRPLVVPAPRAGRTALFRQLNRTEAQPLTDAQAAEILGRPRAPEGAFVRRFLVATVRRLERVREEEEKIPEDGSPPGWMSTDEEELIALQELSASDRASTLRPYLVKVVLKLRPDAPPDEFEAKDCGDLLLIGPGGMLPGPKTVEYPLIVFLPHAPKQVAVV